MEIIKTSTNFDFVRLMKPAVILSLAVIAIGIASLSGMEAPITASISRAAPSFRSVFQKETPPDKIREAMNPIGLERRHHPELRPQ